MRHQALAERHLKEWLSFTWPDYAEEAHVGLAEMYVADERFVKYYNDRAKNEIEADTGVNVELETEKSPVLMLRDIIVKYAK
ncbi:MAG: TipAS antibiotic-recognition domain-containing protein [Peptostreptococcaceae bacterium]|nr:TipAS antibiotic-recognition domain-containing protein [Peptostreptococcaceae bacterium]